MLLMTGEQYRRWKKIATIVAGIGAAVWCCGWSLFSYVAPLRKYPDVLHGRVYEWPNHGHSVYVSRNEDFALKSLFGAWAVTFAVIVVFNFIERRHLPPWERDQWQRDRERRPR